MALLDEESRLAAVRETGLLRAPRDPKFDRYTQLATATLRMPMCLFSLVTDECQFFVSESGLMDPWRRDRETPLSHSFCCHVVRGEEYFIVEDAREDAHLQGNPAIRDMGVVAYAGFPVLTPEGEVLGSFCVIDDKPHQWSVRELAVVKGLTEAVESEIGLRLELARRKAIEQSLESTVTERTAELTDALKKSQALEERFRVLVDRTPQAIAMFDREMRYLLYSQRWVNDYKLQKEGPLFGRSHYEIFPGLPERWKRHHSRVLNGESLRSEEDSFLRESGEREWLRWELVPWRQPDGEIGGLIMLTEVLTERRLEQAELRRKYVELQEASEKLARAQEAGRLLHWSYNPEVSSVRIDSYRGPQNGEFSFDEVLDKIDPEFRENVREQVERAASSSDAVSLEVKTSDCRTLWIAGARKGSVVTGIVQDTTEFSLLKNQLRESQKMEALGLLASGVAHDLNNILCGILLPVEMSRAELEPTHPVQQDLEMIHEAGRRAENLVRQLLLFSRRKTMKAEIVNVNSVVDSFRGILTKLLPKRIQMTVSLEDEIEPKVRIDPSALEQVLLNLVANAKDAMPEEGAVAIEVAVKEISPSKKVVVVAVRDSGPGIPEEIREKVFEAFFTTKATGEGTGLGLSICSNIVKEAGGRLRLERSSKGTCFQVELPYEEGLVATSANSEGRLAELPGGHEKVLVVDDDDSVRRLLTKFLESIGYQVRSFETPAEALRSLEKERAELLLAEVNLPGMDGRELASEARVIHSSLNAVLMSADSTFGVLGQKNYFLKKPFGTLHLAQTVRMALDSKDLSADEATSTTH